MTQRKPYEVPRLIRVTLNPTQAVLTACSTAAASISVGTGSVCTNGTGGSRLCRRAVADGGDDSKAVS